MAKEKNLVMASKIKRFRARIGYTQAELADEVGLASWQAIKFYEMGLRTPCNEILLMFLKLAKRYGNKDITSIQWFYDI